ncbi:MAG TPA: helix-turn-helix transcriptional regulator [Chloroflexota bacterium]|nr:helix-turn-helix transcriptional regulator [Chloroflexota bacterium]
MMAVGLGIMGGLEQAAGRSATAAQLFGAEAAARVRLGRLDSVRYPPPTAPERYAEDVASARHALGDDAFAAAWARGEAMSVDEATRMVLVEQRGAQLVRQSDARRNVLTPREREVATLVARGLSNRQIAEVLVFGERTAEAHVAHCLAKLGLASRTQLAAWAITEGKLEISQPAVRT